MARSARAFGAALSVLLLATPALAHTGHGSGFAMQDGFQHPLNGLDHLLAMVAVGLWAWQIGGRSVAMLPLTFVAAMAVGAAAAMGGLGVNGIEFLIVGSVVILGLALALEVKAGSAVAVPVIALFAMAHGQAHGAEAPLGADPVGYVAGFLAATALLHVGGIGLGMLLARQATAARVAGALIALAGVGLATI